MKTLLFTLLLLSVTISATSQLKAKDLCDPFVIDVLTGQVNQVKADWDPEQIKKKFPCFTATEAENAGAKCGGTITFKDKDLVFFTSRDYIEIGENFKGKLSLQLIGAARNSFFKTLGHPKLKDANWDAYQMQYGTMILYYNKAGKVNKVQLSTASTEVISLCE
ncbi:MAG: hypothetical protein H7Y31_00795 [Chitinophagaceae bacterium]|nr:hypothetical protein [Chitinophagaceae bacterium]